MVSGNEVQKAMDVLGITDVHVEFTYVKKVHKKLLLKWHPDSCPEEKAEEYTKRSAEINAAFDILEKAYEIGMMGPGVKDFRETANEMEDDKEKTYAESSCTYANSTENHNSTNSFNNEGGTQNTYNTYSYYRDIYERQERERERREYEINHSNYLCNNGICNFIFYAICFKYIYKVFTEIDLGYKNMYIKETPYYFSIFIAVFYILKILYFALVLDGDEAESMMNFCGIYIPISFTYPFVYTFMHGAEAAMVFSVYFAGWAIFELLMNIEAYVNTIEMNTGTIETIKRKKVSVPFIFFTVEEAIVVAFGIYVVIEAIYIK